MITESDVDLAGGQQPRHDWIGRLGGVGARGVHVAGTVDGKRIHTYCELVHETEGWVAATAESIHIHVDMSTRRSAPWPDDILANLEAAKKAHAHMPWPERAGRKIGIVRK